MSTPALPPLSAHDLLACMAAALDAIGVGLALCRKDGVPLYHNATLEAAIGAEEAGALCQRLAAGAKPLGANTGDGAASVVHLSDAATLVVVRTSGELQPAAPGGTHGLSRREAEVARLLARRYTNHEVADALGISVHTARHHAERVFHKLGVTARSDVAAALSNAVSAR